ncbi:MAG: NADH-quinone oxidoreductase subunit J [Ignavibacteriaceae bacterium]|nr:NADH-quinone oxidoreductase subunit J [Ignavibacteriaceae bacterium]
MSIELVLFIIFSAVAAVSAILMITRANPVISALFLILNFASLAGLYLLLNAQFIAVAQVIVYAGAIMVLFLFVLMLLKPEKEKLFEKHPGIKIFAVIIAGMVFLQLMYLIFLSRPSSSVNPIVSESVKAGTIEQIGRQLYTNYVLPFEAAGFLLLAATIGAFVLAKKKFE